MLTITTEWFTAFLLVLARVGGLIALAPLPGTRLAPASTKVSLALLLALLLLPLAQVRPAAGAGIGTVAAWMAQEAAFGLAVGVALQFLSEMMGLAAQLLGFQAGYSYINTVDPTTQVDATILNVILTLLGGLLLFALDLHLHLIRALAVSLERIPAGEFRASPQAALQLARVGSAVFETAVRLAFPIVALLLVLDVALALLSYVNARMQLLTLSFPIKMAATMLVLFVVLLAAPRLFHQLAARALGAVEGLLVHGR
jgi:flagellar biosynthetic protein FliR